ncbi:MAG TPA: hypothetical protein DCW31_05690 [Lactobacillus sp.]|nr:hypothetical protein [Lactobacillus sp.]
MYYILAQLLVVGYVAACLITTVKAYSDEEIPTRIAMWWSAVTVVMALTLASWVFMVVGMIASLELAYQTDRAKGKIRWWPLIGRTAYVVIAIALYMRFGIPNFK